MAASSIALQGVEQADSQLDAAASQIVQAGSASTSGGGQDVVSLSEEMVALMSAQNQFALSADVLQAAEETQQSRLDVIA
ncbi:MAG TPA: flagellar basal body rod C-terminal domain-containing protein [Terriglobales bacterium]|nr:flagellar basal body rod C-terminal domain-containing protein [Terriglobales bacterium]